MAYKVRPPADDYPEQWSLIEVQMIDGTTQAMNLPVSPTIQDYFLSKMRETGFLALRNGQESLSIRADKIVAFKLTLMTTGENK
jgi:hypothetical protein